MFAMLEPSLAEFAVMCLKTEQRMILPFVVTNIFPSSEYASQVIEYH